MTTLQALPIVERWDCHRCGVCCRGSLIYLDAADLEQLRGQRWDERPEFRGQRLVVRDGWFGGQRLAQRPDGRCVFLDDDGLCRVHKEFGADAKPHICRMFPLQVVPAGEDRFVLTTRRSCPSAAADKGRPVSEQLGAARRVLNDHPDWQPSLPPPLAGRQRFDWPTTLRVLHVLTERLTDRRFPLVVRLVQGLRFCDLLESCRLDALDSDSLTELLQMLTAAATDDEATAAFRDRVPPDRGLAMFRQAAAEYVRLHPTFVATPSWAERWRLIRLAWRVARGKGTLAGLHPAFPPATFADLERPLGRLPDEVYRPFDAYFESLAVSHQYALVGRADWPIVDSFRTLALSHPIGLWLLRYACGPRPPTAEDAAGIVAALDRGQGFATLTGLRHRLRVRSLNDLAALPRLIAWYVR